MPNCWATRWNRRLPDGKSLAQALLERDDSPLQEEFRQAWSSAVEGLSSMAVVFDIGGTARDDEHIHSAVKRWVSGTFCRGANPASKSYLRLARTPDKTAMREGATTILECKGTGIKLAVPPYESATKYLYLKSGKRSWPQIRKRTHSIDRCLKSEGVRASWGRDI